MFERLLKRLFDATYRPKPPAVAMQAQPITLNPSTRQALVRNVARLARLYDAVEHGGPTALRHEIERRKGAVIATGYPAPANAAEAHALLKQLGAS